MKFGRRGPAREEAVTVFLPNSLVRLELGIKLFQGRHPAKVVEVSGQSDRPLIQKHTFIAMEHNLRRNNRRLSLLRMSGNQCESKLIDCEYVVGPIGCAHIHDRRGYGGNM